MNRKMMRVLTVVLALACAVSAWAGDSKPYLTASQSLATSGEVISVDLEARTLVLKRENGQVLPYKVSDTAYNFDQVKVGDVVDYSFESRMSLMLVGPADALPEAMEQVSQTRAEPGEMPLLTTESTRIKTATVVSIDLEANAFQLEWHNGSIDDYTTEETEILQQASVGDHLVLTQSDRLVLSVSRPGQQ